MEVDEAWIAALAPLQERYPFELPAPRSDNFGIALFSREPWQRAGIVRMGPESMPSVEMRMTHQGHELVLIGTHLVIASRAIGPDVGSDHRPLRISAGMESHTR